MGFDWRGRGRLFVLCGSHFHISTAFDAEDAGKKYQNLKTLTEAKKQCLNRYPDEETVREASSITLEETWQMHVESLLLRLGHDVNIRNANVT